jgi:hypothetical protein
VAEPGQVKLAVQRTARRLERSLAAGDLPDVRTHFSSEFADRDSELGELLERTRSAQLIGTVATRTLFSLTLADGETRVVELLWQEQQSGWRIVDCRVFSLIPGE